MKKFKVWILVLLLIPCFLFSGCSFMSADVYVTGISKGETIGNTTTYTVNYSDGTKSYFSVENGEDGDDLNLEVIKAYCNEQNISVEDYFKSLSIEIFSVKTATNKALQSTVDIYCVYPYSSGASYKAISAGAGVIYKMDDDYSYIITNYHVVETSTTNSGVADEIVIMQYGVDHSILGVEPYVQPTFSSSKYYSDYTFSDNALTTEYIGGSSTFDIAVIKVETEELLAVNPKACAVTVADGYAVAETAIAIGNPNGDGTSVTEGIISVESEEIEFSSTEVFRVMRIDAAVNAGNSGGGLFNINGELIGIVNAKIEDTSIDNIAYAIPYDNATRVADNLIYYHKSTNSTASVKKLYLNITYTTSNSRAVYDAVNDTVKIYDDLVINSVTANKLGAQMGLSAGDTITSIEINGTPYTIERSFQFGDLLLTIRAGDSVVIKGTRSGSSETTTLAQLSSVASSNLTTIS